MSTKSSLKYGPGFHLYDDALDSWLSDEPPVYLRLSDVAFEVSSSGDGSEITVCIPRAIATALGLIAKVENP
jgi:hypothetical protein